MKSVVKCFVSINKQVLTKCKHKQVINQATHTPSVE